MFLLKHECILEEYRMAINVLISQKSRNLPVSGK
jgi:hypothetical protein